MTVAAWTRTERKAQNHNSTNPATLDTREYTQYTCIVLKPQQLADGIRDAAYQKGGIALLRLMKLDEGFLSGLLSDCIKVTADEQPSNVSYPDHPTNWTKPSGTAMQWALLGPEGTKGRSIRTPESTLVECGDFLRELYEWIAPGATSFRLNLIGKRSSLSPHRERIVIACPEGDEYEVRVRFHLPLITNEDCHVQLNGKLYQLEKGTLYYFNNGSVHRAINSSSISRIHLVWDAVLDRSTYDQYFALKPESAPSFIEDFEIKEVSPVKTVATPEGFPSEPDLVGYAGARVRIH